MKNRRIPTLISLLVVCLMGTQSTQAQFFKKLKERVKQRTEETINRKVDEKTEEKAEQVIDSVFSVGKKPKNKNGNNPTQSEEEGMGMGMEEMPSEPTMEGSDGMGMGSMEEIGTPVQFEAYSKYDFVPGEPIIAFEDFSQDEVGDLPALWNTNCSAEVVNLNQEEGKWMQIVGGMQTGSVCSYVGDFIEEIPENFTLEYDVIFNYTDSWAYARFFGFVLSDVEDPSYKMNWPFPGENLFRADLTYSKGAVYTKRASNNNLNSQGEKEVKGLTRETFQAGNKFHVAIWRQKTRVRVYINETKVFDVPRALEKGVVANALRFHGHITNEGENAYISNIRYAVGKPDLRSKLLTEGRLVTYGITFDSGSAQIKPESTGTLKKIAEILNANPEIQVKIVGHTDTDGDETFNLKLSEDRANSVLQALVNQFGVSGSQLMAEGKGESELLDPGNSPLAKAKNRRVEFIKL